MKQGLSQKLKYVSVSFGNAILKHSEKRAYREFVRIKRQIAEFKDMGCFGNSENDYWECGSFRGEQVCCRENCPMYPLNKAYMSAYYAWKQSKIALYKQNCLLNAMREDLGIRRAR